MQIPDSLKNRTLQPAPVAIVAFMCGVGLGYIFGKRKAELRLHEWKQKQIAKEVAEIEKSLDEMKARRQQTLSVEEARQRLMESMEENPEGGERLMNVIEATSTDEEEGTGSFLLDQALAKRKPPDYPPSEEFFDPASIPGLVETIGTIPYTMNHGSWDQEAELASRDPEGPYILHVDEYIADEMDFHQETLTYYAADDVMADSNDAVIYDYANMMGELKFGHGSRDPSVVYIRNEKIHVEWEILLDEGSFAQEVLGEEMEHDAEEQLHHSVLKFRQD